MTPFASEPVDPEPSLPRRFLGVLVEWLPIAAIAALWCCVFAFPRSWLQESIASSAISWLPFAVIIGFAVAIRASRRGSLVRLFAAVFFTAAVFLRAAFVVGSIAKGDGGKRFSGSPVTILFTRGESSAVRQARSPDIVAEILPETASPQELPDPYGPQVVLGDDGPNRIHVWSKRPHKFGTYESMGDGVLAAGTVEIPGSNARPLLVGLLALSRTVDESSFQRNRVTSRRLATRIKNSDQPSVVIGAFETTIFSKLVLMYPEQLLMRWGRDASLSDTLRDSSGFHVFSDNGARIESVERLGEAGVLVQVIVGEPEPKLSSSKTTPLDTESDSGK